jgi:alpha-beta hydrolase superfamily lysophospholipase
MTEIKKVTIGILNKALKAAQFVVVITLTALLTVILVNAFDARKLGHLQIWHETSLQSEFKAKDFSEDMTFDDYLDIEEAVFTELNEKVSAKLSNPDKELFNRYYPGSFSNPSKFKQDYNRSYELVPDDVQGGVVLLHGLTDSPYSLKDIGKVFYEKGFHVLSIRLPGHGTVPGALIDVKWQDWLAAVELACRDLCRKIGDDKPFYMAGYSNGGALSLHYAIEAMGNDDLRQPDRLFLFSPAVGITKFAALSDWLQIISFIPYFENSRWRRITPEYDPFKYNSFPLNASEQTYELTLKTKAEIEKLSKKANVSQLPPIITFQSVVDSTVIINDLIHKLYGKLKGNEDELVLFDVNRTAYLHNFFKSNHDRLLESLSKSDKLGYTLTVVGNIETSNNVIARSKDAEELDFSRKTVINTKWPRQLYSLSHLAIPVPIDDALYGLEPPSDIGGKKQLQLGRIELRGEKNLLRIKADDLLRVRSNPFFDYIEQRIKGIISEDRDKATTNDDN